MTLRDDVRWLRDAADSVLHGALPTWPRTWSTKEGEHLGTMVQELHSRWFRLAIEKTTWQRWRLDREDEINGLRATNERLTDEQLAFGAYFMPEATRHRMRRLHVALARLERIISHRNALYEAAVDRVIVACELVIAVRVLAGQERGDRHVRFRRRNQPDCWLELCSSDRRAFQFQGYADPSPTVSTEHYNADAASLYYLSYALGRLYRIRAALRAELVRLVLDALPGGPRP